MTRQPLSIILVLFFCFTLPLCAQTTDTTLEMQQINAIKLNPDYIYAEATAAKWEKAYENAKAMLEVNVEEWIKSCKGVEDVQGVIAKSENKILQNRSLRGKLFRAFLYVKKSDIIVFSDSKDVVVVGIQQNGKTNETKSSDSKQGSVVNTQPEIPVITYEPTDDEKRMIAVTKSADIEAFVKKDSRIKGYGKYQTLPASDRCYLFVYNREGGISAYLLHDASGYTNVRTGKADDISNYKGCGAIWFKY